MRLWSPSEERITPPNTPKGLVEARERAIETALGLRGGYTGPEWWRLQKRYPQIPKQERDEFDRRIQQGVATYTDVAEWLVSHGCLQRRSQCRDSGFSDTGDRA